MNKKIVRVFLYIAILILTIFSLNKVVNVKADSGWDSSYDGGSSSSSDWGGSSSSSHSSSSSSSRSSSSSHSSYNRVPCTSESCKNAEKAGFILVILFFGGIFIFVLALYIKFAYDEGEKEKELINRVKKLIPDFDIDKFLKDAYKIFYDVQIGWMEFDYDKLKELLTDELYNTYLMDLEVLKQKGQKNIMNSFDLRSSRLIDIKEENDKFIAKVELEVSFVDYIEDIKTHKALRGSKNALLINTYILTFERTKDINENICPSCGASVEGNSTGICEYCKSKLVNNNYNWVMSKKEKTSQR